MGWVEICSIGYGEGLEDILGKILNKVISEEYGQFSREEWDEDGFCYEYYVDNYGFFIFKLFRDVIVDNEIDDIVYLGRRFSVSGLFYVSIEIVVVSISLFGYCLE